MQSPNPPSKGVRYFLLVSIMFMLTLSMMMVMSNVNVDHHVIATIRRHASKLNTFYSNVPSADYYLPTCEDCGGITKPKAMPRKKNKTNFASVFGNYKFPEPNCDSKLLVYECNAGLCGGLGDREKGIMSSFLLALLTDRTFVIDHRRPCDIKKFMEPNIYDWSKCLLAVAEARKKGQRMVHNIDGKGSAIPANFSKLKPGDMWTEHVVTIHINYRLQSRIKEHPNVPTKLPWLLTLPPEVVVTGLMHVLFNTETVLDKHISTFLNENTKMGDLKLVAVHIRSEFLKKDRDVPIVLKFLEQYNDKDKFAMYVACDKPDVRNMAMRALKNFISVNRTIIHIDSNVRPCDGVYTAVFEQQILSRADILVMTPSGFSRLAAYIRGTSEDIYMLQPQEGNNLTHFEKIQLKELPIKFRNS